jgi:short-subunit dehydrogenase
MSSYSGEIGLHFRTPYCSSKFAVNGFFESLRMEVKDEIDITIICPITVETSFREHSILKPKAELNAEPQTSNYEESRKQGSSMSV